ncbi:MAG: Gfo/Idh/MocA family oxidoreductase [Sedimentisphaerales bacterium]|nr:Gfo/Idh/MocA family oxidoreductase [Sedimentisphaerales bacterium]
MAKKTSTTKAKTRPIKIGILGLGRAGWNMHCRDLDKKKKYFQIVAGCDPLAQRRQKMEETYGAATYKNIQDFLADPNMEVVSIATRSCDHLEHTRMALKAGKIVFLEKPITDNYADAKKLKTLAKKYPNKLFIRHNRRFESGFLHIRQIIESGILGDVFEIKLRRVQFQRRDDWQTLKRYGGGQLLNWGPHIIDHGLRFLESPLKSIWGNLKRVVASGNAEDHLKIILTGKNDRLIDIEISGGAAIGEPIYQVWGTRGALSSDDVNITLRYLDPRKKLKERKADPRTPQAGFGTPDKLKWIEKTIPVKPKPKINTDYIWDALYETIRNRKKFPITIEQAVEVMKVVDTVKKGTKFA